MKYSPEKHRRQTIRLRDYDYSLPGAYFVSICTQDRLCQFGNAVNDLIVLNKAGNMIEQAFLDLSQRFDEIEIKAQVVMPNHCHVIIINEYVRRGESCIRPCIRPGLVRREEKGEHKVRPYHGLDDRNGENEDQRKKPCGTEEGSLGRFIQAFKSATTVEYIRGVKQKGWPPFKKRLWQRNYYEHIIRNEEEFNRIHEYIRDNPKRWATDGDNPANITANKSLLGINPGAPH